MKINEIEEKIPKHMGQQVFDADKTPQGEDNEPATIEKQDGVVDGAMLMSLILKKHGSNHKINRLPPKKKKQGPGLPTPP